MGKRDPTWLPEARQFCRDSGIKIMAWGPDLLTVEAKSTERAKEIVSKLGQLGFKVVEDEDDSYAGMLSRSLNPAAVGEKNVSFNISRRPWIDLIEPLIWVFGSLLLVPGLFGNAGRHPSSLTLPIGLLSATLFFWDGVRMWGWRLDIRSEGLRVRRYYRWSMIPWGQISSVESVPTWGRNKEAVVLKVASHTSERLGSFGSSFARNLRDRLRSELTKRGH